MINKTLLPLMEEKLWTQETPKEHSQEHLLNQAKDQEWANIPKAKGNWLEKLWNLVERAKQGSHTFASTPLEEIHAYQNPLDFDKKTHLWIHRIYSITRKPRQVPKGTTSIFEATWSKIWNQNVTSVWGIAKSWKGHHKPFNPIIYLNRV